MAEYNRFLDPHTAAEEVYGLRQVLKLADYDICHTHNFCECMTVFDGYIKHIVNDEVQIIGPNQICFIRANDIHCNSRYNDELVNFYNIGIPDDLLKAVTMYYNIDIEPILTAPLPPIITLDHISFKSITQKILTFHNTEYGALHGILFKNLLADFLYLFSSQNSDTTAKILPQWFSKLLDEMNKPENFISGLARLLELSNYSQEYLNRCFRKYLDVTPTEYINTLRIYHAKNLIIDSQVSITDACFTSGFQTMGHFYKEFQKHFKCTPKQFVVQQQKKNKILL